MQNAILRVDKQKANVKGNVLKLALSKLNASLAVFFNKLQNAVVNLGNDTLSQAGMVGDRMLSFSSSIKVP